MRVAVAGKGGVGKTTVAALLARAWSRRGRRVLAVDTDSDPGLGLLLGLDLETVNRVPLLPRDLVVGHGDGSASSEELIERYAVPTPTGPVLLHAGAVTAAGAGCACGARASIRSLLGAALDQQADVAVVDVAAGLEALGRASGTLAYADVLVIVAAPTRKAVLTAARTRDLAEELGIPRVAVVGNQVRDHDDAAFLKREAAGRELDLVVHLPRELGIATAERQGLPVPLEPLKGPVDRLLAAVEEAGAQHGALRRKRDRIDRRLAELDA